MLSTTISVCTHVASLRDDTSRLLFTWAIAHTDEFGRLTADPRKFRALVCPNHELTPSQLAGYFREWAHQKLIRIYSAEGAPFMELRAFAKYNANLCRSATGRSRVVPPPPPTRRARAAADLCAGEVSSASASVPGQAGGARRPSGDRGPGPLSRSDAQCATKPLLTEVEARRSQEELKANVSEEKVTEGNRPRVAPRGEGRERDGEDPTVRALNLLAASSCITLSPTAAAEVFLTLNAQLRPEALLLEVGKFVAQVESKGETLSPGKAKLALLRWLEKGVQYAARGGGPPGSGGRG